MASCKNVEQCRYIFFSEQPNACHLYDWKCGYSNKRKPYFAGEDETGMITCLEDRFSGGVVKHQNKAVAGSVYYRQEQGKIICMMDEIRQIIYSVLEGT